MSTQQSALRYSQCFATRAQPLGGRGGEVRTPQNLNGPPQLLR